MKDPQEYINQVIVNEANLDHIAKTGRINGTLYTSLRDLFKQAQDESYNQAVIDCQKRLSDCNSGSHIATLQFQLKSLFK